MASHQATTWRCNIAIWLPYPPPASKNFKQLAAAKTPSSGNWLASKSLNGETLTLEDVHGTTVIKLFSANGLELLSLPISLSTFAFAFISEAVTLATCAASNCGSYTFACRFFNPGDALECAKWLKTALTVKSRTGEGAVPIINQKQPEILLMQAIQEDPERAGTAWWKDFPQLVQQTERLWDSLQT